MIFWFGDEPVALKEIFNPLALFRGIELRERAEQVFGNKKNAMQWVVSPNRKIGGNKPLDISVVSDEGLKNVLTVLGRIEHGIYS